MKIRNDINRVSKEVEIGDLIWISSEKYFVYALTEKSIKIESREGRILSGFKRKDFINKNTFSKNYFFDKEIRAWRRLLVISRSNMDYM